MIPGGRVVFENCEGYKYVTTVRDDGALIVRLVPIVCDKYTYFTKITAEDRKEVERWLDKQGFDIGFFSRLIRPALRSINYEYYIANLEPSVEDGKIYYSEDTPVGVGFSYNEWEQMAKDYAPERGSRLANLYEIVLWYAVRIARKQWTLDYVQIRSVSAWDLLNESSSSKKYMEKSGARICGGYRDGSGNTSKIVSNGEKGYAIIGGDYTRNRSIIPVGDVYYTDSFKRIIEYGVGVVVLTESESK